MSPNGPKGAILQIAPPATPVFAVYDDEDAKDGLLLRPCPVVAMIEDENGSRRVLGLCLDPDHDELRVPVEVNFLGYADSREDATIRFAPEHS